MKRKLGGQKETTIKRYFENTLKNQKNRPKLPNYYRFAVIRVNNNNNSNEKNNETLVGLGEISINDNERKLGTIEYIVNKNYWKQGIATQTAKL